MTTGNQAAFAASQGWGKGYVSNLKKEGRLVFTADGLVDFEASLERIKASTGAPERAAPAVQGKVYSQAQDEERFYSAALKRLEYEREIGKVLERGAVDGAVDAAAAVIRTAVEAWRDTMPPQLAALAGDEQRIGAFLAGECETLLVRLADAFAKMAKAAEDGDEGDHA